MQGVLRLWKHRSPEHDSFLDSIQWGQSRLLFYSVLLAVAIAVGNLMFVLFVHDELLKAIVFQLPYPLWNLLAALALFYAAKCSASSSRRLALAWGMLAIGRLFLFVGEVIAVILTVRLGVIPFPSLADSFFLAFYPLFLFGILLLPLRRLNPLGWVKTGLDISVVLISSVLVLWIYWLGPLVASLSNEQPIVQLLSLAYPTGNVVLLWALLMLLYRPPAGEKIGALWLLGIGLVSQILLACIYGHLSVISSVVSNDWLSLGWLLTNLVFALAGIWQATRGQRVGDNLADSRDETAPTKLNTWVTYLPYGCAIAAFAMLEQTHYQTQEGRNWLTWGVGLSIGLVLLRQMMTLRENALLFAQVQQKSDALSKTNQELRETQSMLVHAEKMNALGQVVAGVAHEINNPVAFVNSNIHALKQMIADVMIAYDNLEQVALAAGTSETQSAVTTLRKKADIDFLREDLVDLVDSSLGGLTRVRKIVEGLRNFSRLDEAESKVADLREGIESSLLIANPILKNHIEVESLLPDTLFLKCYPAELNQVFLNLILNAAHAITDVGQITIAGHDTGKEIVLTFQDTGCGMSADVMQQIFHPFFTTKPVGVGTGLGLSIAYKIITAEHGGTIDVTSEIGQGTTFTIKLPKESQP